MEELQIIKPLKATHEGPLKIGDKVLNCAVLEDGTRVLAASSVFEAFDRPRKGKSQVDQRVAEMPSFIDAKNLQPFVDETVIERTGLINYSTKKGGRGSGYDARVLPAICKVYLDARAAGALTPKQLGLARASEVLLIALSNIGILALVDEATGYQYDRERDELQKILTAYVSPDVLVWQKTFHDPFYKEMFRLRGWDFTTGGINQRPGVVGKWTNMLVYDPMPPGVMDKVKEQSERAASGHYKYRFHQSLTPDVGREHLKNQILAVTTLMSVSRTWEEFLELFRRRFGGQLSLDLDDPIPPSATKSRGATKGLPKPKENNSQLSLFDQQLKGLLAVAPPNKKKKGKAKDSE